MNEILQFLKSNREWFFSGIGVFILSGIVWLIKRLISGRHNTAPKAIKAPISNLGEGHGNTNITSNVFNGPVTVVSVDNYSHQSKGRINFAKLAKAAHKELKSGEKIEAEVVGRIMLERPYDDEIVGGLFAATNHRLIVISPSTSNNKKTGLAYHQIGSVTLQDGIINVILPDEIFNLTSIDEDPLNEFEKFFKYCTDKIKLPAKKQK